MERIYTDDMDEISGFGGGYETACRAMVLAGLQWLDEHPGADPHFKTCESIYGVCLDDNNDAKDLTKAMITAAEPGGGATGAMHQATVSHVLWIMANGWDKYVVEMKKPNDANATSESSGPVRT
jgi:hypothetical protein